MAELRISNWDKYQSKRKDRDSTPWVKFHRRALMSPTWHQMVDSERGQFIALLLLADADGVLSTDDPVILQRMAGMTEPIDIQRFFELGLIEGANLATKRQPYVPLEKEVEVEKEVEKERERARAKRAAQLPLDWSPSDRHFEQAKELGFDRVSVDDMAEDMRLWAKAKGETKKDWDAAFSGWMRRERKNGRSTGPPKTRTRLAGERLLQRHGVLDGNQQTSGGGIGIGVRGQLPKPAT